MIMIKFDNQLFVGREEPLSIVTGAFQRLSKYQASTLIYIWGIGGIGKTWLLNKIKKSFDGVKFPDSGEVCICVYSDLYQQLTAALDSSKRVFIKKLASDFLDEIKALRVRESCVLPELVLDEDDLLNLSSEDRLDNVIDLMLRSLEQLSGKVSVIFLFDEIHKAEDYCSDEYAWVLNKLVKPVLRSSASIVILASRRKPGRTIQKDQTKFQLPRPPQLIYLSSLGRKEIEQFISARGQSANPRTIDILFEYAMGHPRLCEDVLSIIPMAEEFPPESSVWKQVENALLHLIAKENLNAHEKTGSITDKEYLNYLESLSLLKEVDLAIIDKFINSKFLSGKKIPHNPAGLLSNLLKTNTIDYAQGKYELLPEIRTVLKNLLKAQNYSRWMDIHLWAYDIYLQWLKDYPYEPIIYAERWFYHAISLLFENQDSIEKIRLDLKSLAQNNISFEKSSIKEIDKNLRSDPEIAEYLKKDEGELFKREFLNSLMPSSNKREEKVIMPKTKIVHLDRVPVSIISAVKQTGENKSIYPKPSQMVGKKRWAQLRNAVNLIQKASPAVICIIGRGGFGKTEFVHQLISELKKNLTEASSQTNNYGIIIPKFKAENSNNNLSPDDYSAIDLSWPNWRDTLEIEKKISSFLKENLKDDAAFSGFNGILSENNALTSDDIAQLHQQWVQEYNALFLDKDIRLVLFFDTVEKMSRMMQDWLENYATKLKNTFFVLAGRDEPEKHNGQALTRDLANRLASQIPGIQSLLIELELLDKTDSREYIKQSAATLIHDWKEKDEPWEKYWKASSGHPVILSMLLGLPERVQIAQDILEKRHQYKKEARFDFAFREVAGAFISRNKLIPDPNLHLYNLLVVAQRGLTPGILFFALQNLGVDIDEFESKKFIEAWIVQNKPLIKVRFYGDELRIIPHDAIFEYSITTNSKPQLRKYYEILLEYYRNISISSTNLSNQEEFLFDRLYYEYLFNPRDAYSYYVEQIERARRSGNWPLFFRFLEEWDWLINDKWVVRLLNQNPIKESNDLQIETFRQKLLSTGDYIVSGKELESALVKSSLPTKDITKITNMFSKLKDGDVEVNRVYRYLLWILDLNFSLLLKGNSASPDKDLGEFLQLLNAVIEILRSTDNLLGQFVLGDAYYYCGYLNKLMGRNDLAKQNFSLSSQIYEKTSLYTDAVRVYSHLAELHTHRMDCPFVMLYTRKAERMFEKATSKTAKLLLWQIQALLFLAHGDVNSAIEKLNDLPEKFDFDQGGQVNSIPWLDWRRGWLLRARLSSLQLLRQLAFNNSMDATTADQISLIEKTETLFAKADKNISHRFELENCALYQLRSTFFVDLLMHLQLKNIFLGKEITEKQSLEVIQGLISGVETNGKKYTEKVLGDVMRFPAGNEVMKARAYVSLAKLGILHSSREEFIKPDNEVIKFLALAKQQLKLASQVFPHEDLFGIEGDVELISGDIVLRTELDSNAAIRVAGEHFRLAVEKFIQYDRVLYLNLCLDYIWRCFKRLNLPNNQLVAMVNDLFPFREEDKSGILRSMLLNMNEI